MIDTGCSVSLISVKLAGCLHVHPERVCLETMSRDIIEAKGFVLLEQIMVDDQDIGPVKAYVLSQLPNDFDFIIGLDVVMRLGLQVTPNKEGSVMIHLGAAGKTVDVCLDEDPAKLSSSGDVCVKEEDMEIVYHQENWSVRWRWKDDCEPPRNTNRPNYKIPQEQEEAFDDEIQQWISDGILIPWNSQRDGEIKNIIPLMSVKQEKGQIVKIRPVLDFRFLNDYVVSCPGAATPLCQNRLREWRRWGPNCAVVDLKRAYLQIGIDPGLWCYQAVRWKGQTFVLTKMGFGLSIAPKAMTKIVEYVLGMDDRINSAASSYIDDIFVNEDIILVQKVVDHLNSFGLGTKLAEKLANDGSIRVLTLILGLCVDENFRWKQDNPISDLPTERLTRRQVHKLLGEWLGHFPVCGWLRVVSGYLQRVTAKEKIGWDELVSVETMDKVIEVGKRLTTGDDPVHGRWLVPADGNVVVWVDASNVALGVTLVIGGEVVEDAAWLRKEGDTTHINVSEMDAAIR